MVMQMKATHEEVRDAQTGLPDAPASEPQLIPLNLIFDYPVRWNKYKVLRDLIQNFYDAVPNDEWSHRFSYEQKNAQLALCAKDVGFSYDWLIHIGASTKRDSDDNYAGYFGEGFKIASLCAVRDHGWSIQMRSRRWMLRVVTSTLQVDNRSLKSLAYHVWHDLEDSPDTTLHLAPFGDKALLETVILSFYSPTNPLFGEAIWSSPTVAVYKRSKKAKPLYYPQTEREEPGIIFAGYQALGSNPHPLIFCWHTYRKNDRERSSFYRMDVVKVVRGTVEQLPAKPSYEVLELLRARWYERPRKRYDFDSWYGIISQLVRNVARCPEQTRRWREQYPHLLVARQVNRRNLPVYNRRRQALDWVRGCGVKYRLVQDAFLELGYPTLEEVCEASQGFSVTREPEPEEKPYIDCLETLVQQLFESWFCEVELPPCKVIRSRRAAWQGMTQCINSKKVQLNFRGLTVRYRLPYVALKSTLFRPESFGNALSTYLHELAHMFGGDASASFSHALSELLEVTLTNAHKIEMARIEWEAIAPIPTKSLQS